MKIGGPIWTDPIHDEQWVLALLRRVVSDESISYDSHHLYTMLILSLPLSLTAASAAVHAYSQVLSCYLVTCGFTLFIDSDAR
jgi:hypothetical protein